MNQRTKRLTKDDLLNLARASGQHLSEERLLHLLPQMQALHDAASRLKELDLWPTEVILQVPLGRR